MTAPSRSACLAGQCNDALNVVFCERVKGWKRKGYSSFNDTVIIWYAPNSTSTTSVLPDCLTDISSLGHIAKAEAELNRKQRYDYNCILSDICAEVGVYPILASPLRRVIALLDTLCPEVWG